MQIQPHTSGQTSDKSGKLSTAQEIAHLKAVGLALH